MQISNRFSLFIKKLKRWIEGKKEPSEDVFLNLDAVDTEPVIIHVFGKDHFIKPLNMAEFAIAVNAMNNLQKLASKKDISEVEIREKYSDLFKSMCPTLTPEVTMKLTQPQSIRLFSAMFKIITGEFYSGGEDGKKKVTQNSNSQPTTSLS